MTKKGALLIIVFLFVQMLSGCWGRLELNELGIVLATGIDLEPNGEITVTIISIEPIGEVEGGAVQKSNAQIGMATGGSIFEAFEKHFMYSSRKLVWYQNSVIIIGEEMARKGLACCMDFLARFADIRYDNYVLITEGKAGKVLQMPSDVDKHLPAELSGLIENAKKSPRGHAVELKDILVSLSQKDKVFMIGKLAHEKSKKISFSTYQQEYIKINPEGSEPEFVYLEGCAVIKDKKMIKWLDGEETKELKWITEKIKSTDVLIDEGEKGKFGVSITQRNCNIEIKENKDSITIVVKKRCFARIEELKSNLDIMKKYNKEILEKLISEEITKQMESIVKKAQNDLKADIFGFGDAIFKKNPSLWRVIEDDWDKVFPRVRVLFDIDVIVERTGEVYANTFSGSDNNHEK